MAFFGMGKRPKHRTFGFVPRFYDKEKEELNARIGKYKEGANDTEAVKQRLRSGFGKPISRSYETDHYKSQLRKSNRLVLFIALILILLTLYFLLEYFPSFIETFEKE